MKSPSFLLILSLLAPGLNARALMRIVSLTPATTEILFALNLGEEVKGVSSFCSYPPEVRGLEKVGTFSRPNMERILKMKPDLILATGLEQGPALQELRRLGLKVLVSHPATMRELFDSILDIGRSTEREAEAAALVHRLREELREIADRTAALPPERRPTVFVELWDSPLMTAGPGSFIDEMIRLAGGVNIASDAPRPYPLFSPEVVLQRNPDCVLLAYMTADPAQVRLEKRFAWNRLAAVRTGRVYGDISPDLILRPGPRLVEGLRELQKRLLPASEPEGLPSRP